MIAEAAIAGVTVCFVACLRFTRYVIDREDRLSTPQNRTAALKAIREKRRILERDRDEWKTSENWGKHTAPIDAKLIELADEERKVLAADEQP